MKLENKVAVITGASMGIGEAIANCFAAEGASAALLSRDLGRVEEARARIGHAERSVAIACDVRERKQIEHAVEVVLEKFGRIDIWINNAGHGLLDGVATMDMAACRAMFATNLFGAIDCMQAVIPPMKKQGSGCIINISSVAGHIAVPNMAAYSATKHALNAIGKAARIELRGTGVHVMTVCPGYIQTDFSINATKGQDIKRLGEGMRARTSPDRVANAVLNGYLKKKREVVVPAGDWLKVKMYQFCPQLVEYAMARMLKPTTAENIAALRAAQKR